jgi:hypothetical protein
VAGHGCRQASRRRHITRSPGRRRPLGPLRPPSPALTAASGPPPPARAAQAPSVASASSPGAESASGAPSPLDALSGGEEDEIADTIGQLSLNEDAQVRWHGKASGLHLLAAETRADAGRNEGGIWRFPRARVWPPLPRGPASAQVEDTVVSQLPDVRMQEHLLQLYFTYVHPALPVVHKESFLDDFKSGCVPTVSSPFSSSLIVDAQPRLVSGAPDSPYSTGSGSCGASSSSRHGSPLDDTRPRRIPTVLLLAMFAVAARYSATSSAEAPLPPPPGSMWSAGDAFGEAAKTILDRTYASSRPGTVQALLLLAYREIGIGAMAQAWLYVGMAVRMAQDLGMHKSAERWQLRVGRRIFSEKEMQTRKRIWWACVIMDRYVSAYIGRSLPLFCAEVWFADAAIKADHLRSLSTISTRPCPAMPRQAFAFISWVPSPQLIFCPQPEETENWQPVNSEPLVPSELLPNTFRPYPPVPCRLISCFNASAKLCENCALL